MPEPYHLSLLIYLKPATEAIFHEYERAVAPIIRAHGGRIDVAFRPEKSSDNVLPSEVHNLTFPSQEAFEAYKADPARAQTRRCVRTPSRHRPPA